MRQSFNPLAANNIKTSTALLVDTGDKLRREQTLNWPRVKKHKHNPCVFFSFAGLTIPSLALPANHTQVQFCWKLPRHLKVAARPGEIWSNVMEQARRHGRRKTNVLKKHWLCNHISKAPSCTRSCSGVDAECPSVSLPVTLSSNCCSLSGTPETIIRLGSK